MTTKKATNQIVWHSLDDSAIFKILQSEKNGLIDEQVQARLKVYGLNSLPPAKTISSFSIFLSQLNSPLVFVLLAATFISALLKEWESVVVIVLLIVVNAVFGWFQENKSNQAAQKLKLLEVKK